MLYKKITKEENTSCEKYLAPEILDLVHFATSLQGKGEDFLICSFPRSTRLLGETLKWIEFDDKSSQTVSSMITLTFKHSRLHIFSIRYFVLLADLEQNQQHIFPLFFHNVMHRLKTAALLCWTLAQIRGPLPSAWTSSWGPYGRFAVIPPVSNPRSRQNVEAARELDEFLEEHTVPAPDAGREKVRILEQYVWLIHRGG